MSGFATAGGATIKSIQRGTVSVVPASSSTVTINSIDTDKTLVNTSCENGYVYSTVGTSYWSSAVTSNCVLTNATTLTVTSGDGLRISGAGTGTPTLSWEVIEYA